jgi:hypothetical protein
MLGLIAFAVPAFSQPDTTPPSIATFVLDPASVTPTSARMTVTFSEAVTGVDQTDFAINTTPNATATITGITAGATAASYHVNFTYSGTSGSLQMAIKTSGTGIADTAGNLFVGHGTAATVPYPVNNAPPADMTPPTVTSLATPGGSLTSPISLALAFSEAVTGVSADDFIVSPGATVGAVTGSGANWTVPVSFTGSGPVTLTLIGGATTNIRDGATHWFAGGTPSAGVTFTPGTTGVAPVISSPLTATVGAGASFTYTITATNSPTSLTATVLPAGLTFSSPTITGSVTTPGTYNIALGATNASGSDSKTLVLTVTPAGAAPVISSPLTASVAAGSSFSYTVTATNSPTSLSAAALPAGLTFSSPTISGSVTTPGTYNISLGATNASGADSKTLVLTVTPAGAAPVISSPLTASVVAGSSFSYTITATNSPTSLTATVLPSGLTFSSPTISGSVTTPGTYNVAIGATNAAGSDNKTLVLTVTPAGAAPVISSALTASVGAGAPFSYTITATNSPTAHTATGLPSGLTFTAPAISGSVATPGTYNIALGAANAAGLDSKILVLTVTPVSAAPVISSPLTASVVAGSPFSYTLTATNSPTSLTATALPAGLTFSSPGITGSVSTPGTYNITLGATNASGSDNKTLVLTVTPVGGAPVITSPLTATVAAGSSFSYTITAANSPTSFTATALPAGLSFSSPTISGSVASPGTYNIVIGAANASGSVSKTLVLTVTPAGTLPPTDSGKGSGPVTTIKRGDGLIPGQPFTLPSTTASGQPITWILVSGNATLQGNKLTPKNRGAVVVRAVVAGASPAQAATIAQYEIDTDEPSNTGNGNHGKAPHKDRLSNLSSRVRIAANDASRSAVAGFVITGDASKQVLVRAIGPSLATFGIKDAVSGAQLQLFDQSSKVIAQNDGWSNDAAIAAAGERVGAFKLAGGSRDSALLVTLPPGAYTAQVGATGSGIALLEVYDATTSTVLSTEQLINISTRGFVDSGDGKLIAGFVVSGDAPKRVLVRGIGASLTGFGVPGALADPVLELFTSEGSTLIARNDNWSTPQSGTVAGAAGTAAEIVAASQATGAFPLESGSKDAAVLITLMPGSYSAVVSGTNQTTGAGLVEVYEVLTP